MEIFRRLCNRLKRLVRRTPTAEFCDYCKIVHVPDVEFCNLTRLERRRALMDNYDEKLEEWLS
jgi:hypothetical protein